MMFDLKIAEKEKILRDLRYIDTWPKMIDNIADSIQARLVALGLLDSETKQITEDARKWVYDSEP